MGIAERDYTRNRRVPPAYGRGGSSMHPRFWSVTIWIIVLNVVVFAFSYDRSPLVIGPKTPTYMGEVREQGVTEAQWDRGQAQGLTLTSRGYAHVIVDPVSGEQIGLRFSMPMPFLQSWGHFSAGRLLRGQWDWIPEVWRLITFQFLHASPMHLILNMFGLYIFGPLVEQDLGRKRFLVFYLLCGAAGGALYLLLVALGKIALMAGIGHVPGLLLEDWYTPLIGASAGVFGVLMACAAIAPHQIVYLIFPPIPMRMRTFAWGFFAIALISLFIGTSNAGGQAAHIGGALAGWFLIRRRYWLRDILRLLHLEEGPLRAGAHRRGGDDRVDRILDKARQHGVDSLSPREKRTLHRASEGMRN
jgi:membrane associated rhomboid family serine protease